MMTGSSGKSSQSSRRILVRLLCVAALAGLVCLGLLYTWPREWRFERIGRESSTEIVFQEPEMSIVFQGVTPGINSRLGGFLTVSGLAQQDGGSTSGSTGYSDHSAVLVGRC